MKKIIVMYSGGGTLGPVTPLLAIHEIAQAEFTTNYQAIWVGTRHGVEQDLVKNYGITYLHIASGKLRRYVSFMNGLDLFKIIIGFFQSIFILIKYNPNLCVSAGGNVSVPLHLAAWCLGIPTWIHQQDVQVGLANRLMSPLAQKITTDLEANKKFFSAKKTLWLGNPIRPELLNVSLDQARLFFKLKPGLPVLLATGGGTGSLRVNQLIIEAMQSWRGLCQIIHLSGKERPQEMVVHAEKLYGDFYQTHQFLNSEMKLAYALAEVVICRGGFGTLSELAALKKPAIVIPKPGHQVENVHFLSQLGAAIFLDEEKIDGNFLAKTVKDLLSDKNKAQTMAENLHKVLPPADPKKIIALIKEILDKN